MTAPWLWLLASLCAHVAGAVVQRGVWTAAYWPEDRCADGDVVRATLSILVGVGLVAGTTAMAGLYAFVRRAHWPSLALGLGPCVGSLFLAMLELYTAALLAGVL